MDNILDFMAVSTVPVGIWCQNDVVSAYDATSTRLIDVNTTSVLRHVPAGLIFHFIWVDGKNVAKLVIMVCPHGQEGIRT